MTNNKSIALIIFITAIVLFLMLPIRGQIYRDDFAYAQSVKQFINTGQVNVTEWAAPTLILQILWGGVFTYILGFSFGSLHVSVIILLPIILIYLYKILKELNVNSFNSFFLTILFLSIPFILQFTYTFQTDIPFLALEILSIYYFLRGIKENDIKYLFIGTIFSILGFLIRQIAIALIISAALTILFQFRSLSKRQILNYLIAICFLPIITFGIYYIWLNSNNNQTITQISYQNYLVEEIRNMLPFTDVSTAERLNLIKILNHRFVALFSLMGGLFAIPLLIVLLSNVTTILNSINIKVIILGLLTVLILWGLDYYLFRESFGLGFPIDTYKYELLFPLHWPDIWKFLVAWGIISFITMLAFRTSDSKKGTTQIFFLLVSFILFVLLSITGQLYWDRYVIALLPFAIIFIGLKLRSMKLPKVLLIVIILLLLDSLQMNKTRYDVNGVAQREADYLVSEGIPLTQIIPNQEEFWIYWYTFENQMKIELVNVGGNKSKASIPVITSNFVYTKAKDSDDSMYINEYMIVQDLDINKIPVDINYAILKEVKIRSLLVKTKLYLIKVNNFASYKNGSVL